MACVAWHKCENPEAFPPFPRWEEIFTVDTGELGIAASANMEGEADEVTRSISVYGRVEVSDVAPETKEPSCNSGLIPKFFKLFANSLP